MSAISSYSTAVFFEPLQHEFGWSRVQISSVHMIGSFCALLLGPAVGHGIDRFGARRVGIAAVILQTLTVSMLGLAGPSIWTWRSLWIMVALVSVLYQPMVWSSAVTSLFSAGRGLALAVTLCGTSLCSVLTPPLTVWLIDQYGWRMAYPALALCWVTAVLPLLLLFFTSYADKARSADPSHVHPVRRGFFSNFRGEALTLKFCQVAVAGFSIALVVVSTAVTIVPILSSNGISRGTAAGIA